MQTVSSMNENEFLSNKITSESKCRDIVECNIMSTMDVTRALLPGMVERKRGVIINLSSFLAYGGPLLSVYAASKAFVMQFSKDLQLEYQDSGEQSIT